MHRSVELQLVNLRGRIAWKTAVKIFRIILRLILKKEGHSVLTRLFVLKIGSSDGFL
jgi:hypothetical protein